MPRLLLVETDPFMQRTLQKVFAAEEYFCEVTSNTPEAQAALAGGTFDLILLDLGRLRERGLELLREIRTRHHMPILLLAPPGDVASMVAGLDIGADDYICEPFDPRELMGRVRAQLRRADEYSRPVELGNQIALGSIVLDVPRRDAFRGGIGLNLTGREFELLYLFARNRGKALASQWIFQNIWGYSGDPHAKALTVYIGRLRRKIETGGNEPLLLLSLRGFGYKLSEEPV